MYYFLIKTGTITLGNRQAVEFIPVGKATAPELAEAAQEASLADETPEGRSIVLLAKRNTDLKGTMEGGPHRHFVPFTAQTTDERIDADGLNIRKGAVDQFSRTLKQQGKSIHPT